MLSQFLQPTGIREYSGKSRNPIVSEAPADKQLALFNMAAFNGSGGSQDIGILRSLAPVSLKLYALESSVYTLRPAPSVASPQQVLTTTNNDGFAVGGKYPPNMVGINVPAGSAATVKLQYFNGTAFVDVDAGAVYDSDDYSVTGENYQLASQPLDWVQGGPAGSGLDADLYFLQVVATTAPVAAIDADDLWAGQLLTYFKMTPVGGFAQLSFDWNKPFKLDAGENITPYYNTPSAANYVSGFYAIFG